MKTLFKFVLYALVAVFGLAIVLVAVLVVRNLRDDALQPDVVRLLKESPPQIAASENGYFAWIGVVGRASESPHAWGQRWYQQILASDQLAATTDGVLPPLAIEAEKRDEEFSQKELLCDKPETCLDDVAGAPEKTLGLISKANATLGRAAEAMAFPAYQEPWRPDFAVSSYLAPRPKSWRQLSAMRFALMVHAGRHDQALAQLQREMDFHVRQLRGSVTLIEKMLAISTLRSDYLLLNRYMVLYPDAAIHNGDLMAKMLQPLPDDALRLGPAMATECRMTSRLFLSLKDEALRHLQERHEDGSGPPAWLADRLAVPLYLPNATVNEMVDRYRPVFRLDSESGEAYRQTLENLARRDRDSEDFGLASLVTRNPTGHILVVMATPSIGSWYLKRDDLVMLRAATALQLDVLRRNVAVEDVGSAIRKAGLEHPFTGEAPIWNMTRRTLTWLPVKERQDRPLTLEW